ncbi:DUF3152 domain-containing protein [Actinocrispum wychmicini]|uniref:Uncharacterized protein DUF3152 n=1 Tax=Actinocrispum wychmicini TaxID=1213861 RepID=A0A4R2JWX6_9PSEU|nr:DUF3152 domain-containing protein [Actinocrispum wychmicini]TCO58655.1 uncharacterized protein DUF3152 [Actinocrispum wychmicini]
MAAAWEPEVQDAEKSATHVRPVRRRGLLAVYGWRLYAIPVLLVITALVVWNTAKTKPGDAVAEGAQNPAVGDTGATDTPTGPGAAELPPVPVDLKIPTADLPPGAAYTQAGANTFRVVPGDGPRVGQPNARLYTYDVEIENGINPAEIGGGDDAFAGLVDRTLGDARSWTGADPKIAIQRVSANPTIRVSLTTPETTHKLCGLNIPYESSCRLAKDGRVVINLARWVRGALAFDGDIGLYRQYAINHEVGHAFGNGHLGCGDNGGLAPVMMQQTFGVSDDFVAKLNDAVRGSKDPVKADGKVCKPNAWPNPQGRPAG